MGTVETDKEKKIQVKYSINVFFGNKSLKTSVCGGVFPLQNFVWSIEIGISIAYLES